MTPDDIFNLGLAIRTYDVDNDTFRWRFYEEYLTTKPIPSKPHPFIGPDVWVARIEDVRG